MKHSAWNCRRLGNRHAIRELVDIVQAQDPLIVFFSETWSDTKHMRWIKDRIGFDGCFTVLNTGQGGGLALLWRANANV